MISRGTFQSQQICDSVLLYPQTFPQKTGWESSLCFCMRMAGGTIFWNMVDSPTGAANALKSSRNKLSKLLSLTSIDVKSLAIGMIPSPFPQLLSQDRKLRKYVLNQTCITI